MQNFFEGEGLRRRKRDFLKYVMLKIFFADFHRRIIEVQTARHFLWYNEVKTKHKSKSLCLSRNKCSGCCFSEIMTKKEFRRMKSSAKPPHRFDYKIIFYLCNARFCQFKKYFFITILLLFNLTNINVCLREMMRMITNQK